MATLTYDSTPADQPEFSPEEQESIKIGEQALAEEQQMLAGKFKDAEELEKAYIELQSKLGERSNENESDPVREEVREQDAPTEEVGAVDTLYSASQEYAEKGQLSPETIETLQGMDSKELLDAYMEIQNNASVPDLTEAQVADVQNSVGGAEQYSQLVNWASENMGEKFLGAFDNLINTGDVEMIKLAAAGLKSAYDGANGFEGQMLTGKGAPNKQDVFRSQAEVVAAMQDPRYDRDPAYRNDVFEKLNNSNLAY